MLEKILQAKRRALVQSKREEPLPLLQERIAAAGTPRNFFQALQTREREEVRIIAEIKRASPSRGVIAPGADPVQIAKSYAEHGAAAISVLTEATFFQGDRAFLPLVKQATSLPILRKDFLFDPYQIYESRAYGADALLLIVALLDDGLLRDLLALTHSLQMEALVEVHTTAELERALRAEARIIGINNRNLQTFHTDTATTLHLLPHIPPGKVVVSESGIHTRADIEYLCAQGVRVFLVGEALMRGAEPGQVLQELLGG
ncbi:MAG: indole-3-glycerol phosphate synthase TrpC [Nitrospinota bacterium]|nr:MAG: indole-3-glycerol phosphate synthase TrpC [Nitrospinota bacterium]